MKRLTLAVLMAAFFVTPAQSQAVGIGVSNSNSQSGSSSTAGNSWSSTNNYRNRNNTPSVAIGGGSPSPRTCAANFGVGGSVPGFGLGVNVPVVMRGCAVERAAALVRAHPTMRRQQKGTVYSQVLCQDKIAGRAMVAAGETCLVGRYRNRQPSPFQAGAHQPARAHN